MKKAKLSKIASVCSETQIASVRRFI